MPQSVSKNSKKVIYGLIALAVALGIVLVAFLIIDHFSNSADNPDNVAISVEFDDDIVRIDWSKYETYKVELTESLEITQPGIYVLSGEISSGCISVNTNDNVKLELNNVKITNPSGPAIYVENAKNVVISTTSGSKNELTDGTTYTGYEDDEIGTIFSHDDLLFEGEGVLVVTSKNEDAIVSKDDLVFAGGTYQVTAADDGIRGKDSVYIQSGTFNIIAGGDGIKATNATESERGFVYIADGKFDITAELDGIQAETTLQVAGGQFDIKTGGGSSVASTDDNWGNWGNMPMRPGGPMEQGNSNTVDTASAKGIKATDILLEQGKFTFDCSDDAIHANGNLKITGGDFTIASGDDGIHTDSNLVISDGNINITKSYEGLEGSTVTIDGGTIAIVSSDDGINAAGGSDASSMNRPGANNFKTDDSIYIRIRGGDITVDTTGDSLDSNSNIYIDGGTLIINGPTNGSDNALDHDGGLVITGGTIIASEMAGLMEGGISTTSTSYSVVVNFSTTYTAGTVITLEDNSGNAVVTFTSQKPFNSFTFSSPVLQKDAVYTIKVNNATYQTFTLSSISTQVGTSKNNGMMDMGGGKASGTRPR